MPENCWRIIKPTPAFYHLQTLNLSGPDNAYQLQLKNILRVRREELAYNKWAEEFPLTQITQMDTREWVWGFHGSLHVRKFTQDQKSEDWSQSNQQIWTRIRELFSELFGPGCLLSRLWCCGLSHAASVSTMKAPLSGPLWPVQKKHLFSWKMSHCNHSSDHFQSVHGQRKKPL